MRQTGVDNSDAPQPTTAKDLRISRGAFGEREKERTYVKGVVRRLGLVDVRHLEYTALRRGNVVIMGEPSQ